MTERIDPIADELPDEELPVAENSLVAIGFAAVIMLVGIVYFIQSMSIHSQAGLWPRILSVTLILFAGAQTLVTVMSRRNARRAQTLVADKFELDASLFRRVFTALWLLAYCLVAQMVGFGIAMLVFLPVYMWVMGFRNLIWIVLLTLGYGFALTLIFDAVANVPMWSSRL